MSQDFFVSELSHDAINIIKVTHKPMRNLVLIKILLRLSISTKCTLYIINIAFNESPVLMNLQFNHKDIINPLHFHDNK